MSSVDKLNVLRWSLAVSGVQTKHNNLSWNNMACLVCIFLNCIGM